jgi:two-component system phosphate regulon sensor histidine kinase PhoR
VRPIRLEQVSRAEPGKRTKRRMETLFVIAVALAAALLAALGTAFWYRQRTMRRVRVLSHLVKGLALGNSETELFEEKFSDDPILEDLSREIFQLGQELRAVIQRISSERNTVAALLANLNDGIISVDADARITNLNHAACQILGLTGEILGRSVNEVLPSTELQHLVDQTLRDGQPRSQMLEMGSQQSQLKVSVTLVKEEPKGPGSPGNNGHRVGLVVLQDLTELMRLERVRRDFVANISHELRTPLASVKLMVETLQNVIEEDPEEAPQFLGRIDMEIDGLTQLVRELLELSRIESGQVKLNLKPTDIPQLIEQVAGRMSSQAARRGLEIIVTEPGSPETYLPALADADRLSQVLINLIHNAIKFTPVGGTIRLNVQHFKTPHGENEAGKLVVRVSDSGSGIPPEDLDRIFERFYKVDKARAGQEPGTGLGLAIAKHVIQAHGGEIWVESKVGVGSSFSFTLPVVP